MTCDLAIIGAGPAGLAAAAQAAEHGLSVAVLDEQPKAGGQIYRGVDAASAGWRDILGADYSAGAHLTAGLDHPAITHIAGAKVWDISKDRIISYSVADQARQLMPQRIILATGAIERPMPLPGWTLPGVMTAGAAQILMKTAGILPTHAVLAGSGPLLYLVAAQMVRAGTPPLALIETQTRRDQIAALAWLRQAVLAWRTLRKGMGLLGELRRAGVRRYVGATDIRIKGQDQAEAISFLQAGRHHKLACKTVLLHHGVVPNIQATQALRLSHDWSAQQRCFHPRTDAHGRTELDWLFVAGDGAGIAGAVAAEAAGQIAALAVAQDLGQISPEEARGLKTPVAATLKRERNLRPFLDRMYPPCPAALAPDDETIICRCEETTAGDIRRFAALGCEGPNQTKAFGRCGMGPCQGRYCGLSVTEILAGEHDLPPGDIGYFRIRPPLKPVTLAEMASLSTQRTDP